MKQTTDLFNVNLNYLVYLKSLLTQGSVGKAAKECCISQPAMSYALSKLRRFLGDPLFYKSGTDNILTPYGECLKGDLDMLLSKIAQLPLRYKAFDPVQHKAEITILCEGVFEKIFGSDLYQSLFPYPEVSIQMASVPLDSVKMKLELGYADFALDYKVPEGDDIIAAPLYKDDLVVIARKQNPYLSETLLHSLDFSKLEFASYTAHLQEVLAVSNALENLGVTKESSYIFDQLASVQNMVSQTNFFALYPRSLLSIMYANQLHVIEIPSFQHLLTLSMYWHVNQNGNAIHCWAKEHLLKILKPKFESSVLV